MGGSKIGAMLNQTQITNLKRAARSNQTRFDVCVSAPQHALLLHSRLHSLTNNKLGPQGGAALAEGLKGNSTLTSLQ